MKVERKGSIARAEEALAVPGVNDLSSILTETEVTGDLTSSTTLLRLTRQRQAIALDSLVRCLSFSLSKVFGFVSTKRYFQPTLQKRKRTTLLVHGQG
jgi:hypothetical protein